MTRLELCNWHVRDASSQPETSQAHAEVAGRIRRGAPARVSSHIGVRPGLQLRRQARRVRGCWRDPESGMEAGRTAAPLPIDPDPGRDDQGVEQRPRLLPESRGLRFLSRRGVLLQPASHGVRARRTTSPAGRSSATSSMPNCSQTSTPIADSTLRLHSSKKVSCRRTGARRSCCARTIGAIRDSTSVRVRIWPRKRTGRSTPSLWTS